MHLRFVGVVANKPADSIERVGEPGTNIVGIVGDVMAERNRHQQPGGVEIGGAEGQLPVVVVDQPDDARAPRVGSSGDPEGEGSERPIDEVVGVELQADGSEASPDGISTCGAERGGHDGEGSTRELLAGLEFGKECVDHSLCGLGRSSLVITGQPQNAVGDSLASADSRPAEPKPVVAGVGQGDQTVVVADAQGAERSMATEVDSNDVWHFEGSLWRTAAVTLASEPPGGRMGTRGQNAGVPSDLPPQALPPSYALSSPQGGIPAGQVTLPIVGSLAYIWDRQRDQVLMIHRVARAADDHFGKYNGLGGKLERGESITENLRRELFEEANLAVTDARLRGTIAWPGFGPAGEDWLGFVFVIEGFVGDIPATNPEGKLSWVARSRLIGACSEDPVTRERADLPMWEGDRYFLPLVFDDDPRPFHGVMPYHEGRPIDWRYERLP